MSSKNEQFRKHENPFVWRSDKLSALFSRMPAAACFRRKLIYWKCQPGQTESHVTQTLTGGGYQTNPPRPNIALHKGSNLTESSFLIHFISNSVDF